MTDIGKIFSVPIIAKLALGMPSATQLSSNTTVPRILVRSSKVKNEHVYSNCHVAGAAAQLNQQMGKVAIQVAQGIYNATQLCWDSY